MTTVRECPGCGRRLQLPAALPTPEVQCPACRASFRIEASPAPAADATSTEPEPAAAPCLHLTLDEPADRPRLRQRLPRPPSPMRAVLLEPGPEPDCPEMGAAVAPGCKPTRRDCEPHRGSLIFSLSFIGLFASIVPLGFLLGLPLCAVAWKMAWRDHAMMREGEMDPTGLAITQAGRRIAVIGAVFGCLWLLVAGWFLLFVFAAKLS